MEGQVLSKTPEVQLEKHPVVVIKKFNFIIVRST